ncbi:MAG: hypothetical protein N3G20_12195 [Verrucomicrobiae bacterium]|nr:hypothetical protein [Verrucomicrobiae bacterium]
MLYLVRQISVLALEGSSRRLKSGFISRLSVDNYSEKLNPGSVVGGVAVDAWSHERSRNGE